jgi:hypothetical protein
MVLGTAIRRYKIETRETILTNVVKLWLMLPIWLLWEKYYKMKSATNESLGTIKRRNRRKYLKIWDDQIKQ